MFYAFKVPHTLCLLGCSKDY